jgi:AcrR family transcriptional regulator
MAAQTEHSKMGRPRAFHEDTALEAAMRVFWDKGYEGTSLDDLTEAMGINRSSLYSAFGDKQSLFEKVLARYSAGPMAFLSQALAQPSARQVIESLLRSSVDFLADPTHPKGCLSLQGGMACGSGAEEVERKMIHWRKGGILQIQKRLQRAQDEGDLSKDVDAKDLARYLVVVMNGLGVQAVNGASRSEMNRTVDLALRAIPDSC